MTERLHGIDPFRGDGIHFTVDGSRWVAEWLGPQLLAALAAREGVAGAR